MWFKIFISVIVLSVVTSVTAQSPALVQALIIQESDGNDKAFNEKENAVGCLQIRPGYFKDAQERDPSLAGYSHKDCYSREVSIKVRKAYMNRYARGASDEVIARKHNGGGPNGHKKESTLAYWRSVKAIMDNGGKK